MLGQHGKSAGDKQVDVEKQITTLFAAPNSIRTHYPFFDATEFGNWWSGKYNFAVLRKARNQIVHNYYMASALQIEVNDEAGLRLLCWNESDVLEFAKEVLNKAKGI